MEFLYSIIVGAYGLAIRLASFFVPKARYWVQGRKGWRAKMKKDLQGFSDRPVWVHVSSVGEFEQGRPVIEAIKKQKPNKRIVLTFFSPSGYQLLSDYEWADHIYYLPLDGKGAARDFLAIVNPSMAIFVKYEFWYHYFKTLKQREIPFVLISAKLRPKQLFFKWYGRGYRKVLYYPSFYFVQDDQTRKLLSDMGIQDAEVCGDTRIDRVAQVTLENEPLAEIEQFKGEQALCVVGSSWAREQELMVKWINQQAYPKVKYILAPHEIKPTKITDLQKKLKVSSICYTQIESQLQDWTNHQVLILDCVGILKRIYRYGDWSVIGGGFIDGIHNILEPAAFGVPMMFGPNYDKFVEAHELLERGGAFTFKGEEDFNREMDKWASSPQIRQEMGAICREFIRENQGATDKIMDVLNQKWNELD